MSFVKPNFTQKSEKKLYFVNIALLAIIHCIIALFSTSALKAKAQQDIKIRLAGHQTATSPTGDLSQMKSPDKIVKNQTAKKQLLTNQESNFKASFVRAIKQNPPQASPKNSQTIADQRKPNLKKEIPREIDLEELGYQPAPELPTIQYRNQDMARFIEQNRLFEQASGQVASLDLKSLSSGVQIEIPHGTSLDDLNSAERKFYSFQLRSYKAYVYSLLNQAYRSQTPNDPFPFVSKNTRLHASVTFDKQGYIVRIKTLETGDNIKLQNVFLAALKDIKSIPNPPQEIINDDNEFTLNFVLQIYR